MKYLALAASLAVTPGHAGSAPAQHSLGEPGFDACREAAAVGKAAPEYSMFQDFCEHPEKLKRELKGAAEEERAYVNDQRRHQESAADETYCVAVRSGLSDGFAALKAGPGLGFRRIEKMSPGSWLVVDYSTSNGWTHVVQGPDDQAGWVASYLTVPIRCP
jgi:hypothetical protein